MIYVWFLLVLWVSVVVAHAIGSSRRKLTIEEDAAPEIRAAPDIGKELMRQLMHAGYHINDALRPKLRRSWGSMTKPFPVMPQRHRGTTCAINATMGMYDLFREEIEMDDREILDGDPSGKIERAAQKLATRLANEKIVAFAELEIPRGAPGWAGRSKTIESGLQLRMVRYFDVCHFQHFMYLDVMAVVEDEKSS